MARHKKDRNAAVRVEARRTGQPAPPAAALATLADFELVPTSDLPTRRRQPGAAKLPKRLQQGATLYVGRSRTYAQREGLPSSLTPNVSALDAMFGRRPDQQPFTTEALDFLMPMDDGSDNEAPPITITVLPGQSRHHLRRIAQHHRWRDMVIPDLVQRYLALKYDDRNKEREGYGSCFCPDQRALQVTLADWDGERQLHELTLFF